LLGDWFKTRTTPSKKQTEKNLLKRSRIIVSQCNTKQSKLNLQSATELMGEDFLQGSWRWPRNKETPNKC
jgi:hypothetical protein